MVLFRHKKVFKDGADENVNVHVKYVLGLKSTIPCHFSIKIIHVLLVTNDADLLVAINILKN